MPLPTLEALAYEAACAISDLLETEDEWNKFDAKTPLEQIKWRYCHADCDYFAEALSAVTGWPIVAVSSPTRGPLHRLVKMPDGQMVDVRGCVSEEELQARYGTKKLSFGAGDAFSVNRDPDDLVEELQVFLRLDVAPFNTPAFRAQVHKFADSEGLEADLFLDMPAVQKSPAP